MKFHSKLIYPQFNPELSAVEVVTDVSIGYYILIVLEQKIVWQSHLWNATKGAADEYAADFARKNALEGVPASQWPKQMRDELIKRFVKVHRQDDYDMMQVLAHIVADLVGSPYYTVGAARKGKSRWIKTYADGTAAEMEARAQEFLKCRAQYDKAHTVLQHAAYAQNAGAVQAARQNQTQLEALRANSRDLYKGRFFN